MNGGTILGRLFGLIAIIFCWYITYVLISYSTIPPHSLGFTGGLLGIMLGFLAEKFGIWFSGINDDD